jgi:predicted GIY-YIG superfamily endonuclease
MNKPVTIYALLEPTSNEIRYIGQSIDPDTRLKSHVQTSFTGTTKRDRWIRSLLVNGKHPMLQVISVVSPEEANEAEVRAIKQAKSEGAKLVNGTESANGGSNHGKKRPRPERIRMTFNVSQRTAEIIEKHTLQYGNKDNLLMLLVDRFIR